MRMYGDCIRTQKPTLITWMDVFLTLSKPSVYITDINKSKKCENHKSPFDKDKVQNRVGEQMSSLG